MTTLQQFHESLYFDIRQYGLALHPFQGGIARSVVAAHETPALLYSRPPGDARTVERLMGCDPHAPLVAERHPVIEVRAALDYCAVELVLTPGAWWDQQNLAGKLHNAHQRSTFYALLRDLDGDFCLGFWSGERLSDLHLNVGEMRRSAVLDHWMSTFVEGQDWLRVGVWYDTETAVIEAREVFRRVRALNRLFQFIAWRGDNNFRSASAPARAFRRGEYVTG